MKHAIFAAAMLTAALFTTALCTSAHADYILMPTVGGSSQATVSWGESFSLDIVLTSDTADVHNSAIFELVFTEPGFIYDYYDWADPYTDGFPYDDGTPDLASLPVTLDTETLTGPSHPTDVVDIELSNVILGETFPTGTLVTLDLTVPADYGYTGVVYIAATPDTIANGFDEVPTTTGQILELTIIPEPGTGLLLCIAAITIIRRGRLNAG